MHTIDTITAVVRWLCRKLTLDQLIAAAAIILAVINDEREDIRPRNDFAEKHPHYRKFTVDPEPPLVEPPPLPEPAPTLDWHQLITEHKTKTGKALTPVRRRQGSAHPPEAARCDRCGAPERFLYVNDGKKCSQLRCKVCDLFFPSHRCRQQSNARYWCPHCGWALYHWKQDGTATIYKCANDACPCYTRNLAGLNERERALQQTGSSSQFKLRYQYREYHLRPADLRTSKPAADTIELNRIRNHLSTVGLVLSYSVSFGISSRMTAQILRRMHGIHLSHQTVQNYLASAAVLAARFTEQHLGSLADSRIAGDETYIRVADHWQYTFFVIGAPSRTIRAWHVAENRDTLAAIATLNSAVNYLPGEPALPIEFIGDGNPAYDAAVHVINTGPDGKPSPQPRLQRRTVIGLTNEDDESEQFRPFKQLVERLNRTYKFHTRARAGFKSQQGAVALTALFVAYYNFLRPHGALHYTTPIHVPELHQPTTLQGQWLKLLEMAA